MRFSNSVLLAIVALCALHFSSAYGIGSSNSGRTLLEIPSVEKVKASCRTKATATLFIASGSASISTTSSCTAFASSISSITEVWDDYLQTIKLKPNASCTVAKIEDVISLCAQSVAKVYTSAQGEINVKGRGKGCFNAESDGDAFAKSFAYVFVNMWLGVTDGLTAAEAEAQVSALTYALSEVWAGAKSAACQKNTGSVSDSDESYAAQVKIGIACVFAEVAVKLCKEAYIGNATAESCDVCKEGELEKFFVSTESTANANVCSSTTTVVDIAEGTATTNDIDPVPCEKKGRKRYNFCCDKIYEDKQECFCGPGCSMKLPDNSSIWKEDNKDFYCYCPHHVIP